MFTRDVEVGNIESLKAGGDDVVVCICNFLMIPFFFSHMVLVTWVLC